MRILDTILFIASWLMLTYVVAFVQDVTPKMVAGCVMCAVVIINYNIEMHTKKEEKQDDDSVRD